MSTESTLNPSVKPFDAKEIDKICEALLQRDPWYYNYFKFALYTGMRRSEILALTWHHVDLWQNRGLTVPNHNSPRFWEEDSVRIIDIDETLLGLLLDLRSSSRWVFQKTGKRMLGGTVTLFFTELSRTLGIQVTSERMRWTFSMKVYSAISPANREDWKKIQKILGHKDVSTTKSYFQRNIGCKLP
ncbi:tyrosine-type recombinase/integrase [Deltaproteobacteria bacterium TL4]